MVPGDNLATYNLDTPINEPRMNIRLFKEGDGKQWDRYVMGSRAAASYHLAGWKDVIEKSFGHKTHYLIAEGSNREIQGVLPLVLMKSVLFGRFMISLPYFNYGGICADNEEAATGLLRAAEGIAIENGAAHIELRHTCQKDYGLPAKKAKVSMRLALPQNPDELWRSFPSKLLSQTRRPIKENMYARVGREGELESFYRVFSVNMRDLGTPVYSKEFFRNILGAFPESSWICTVYTKEGWPAASGFLVGFKEVLEIPWASSIRRYNPSSPNMLLYWSVLNFACEKGYSVFDFGRSTPGESTYRFKEQWGAIPMQLYWHYWLRNGGPLPELNPKNPKYQTAIRIWQKLPVSVTKIIGPSIVKNLP